MSVVEVTDLRRSFQVPHDSGRGAARWLRLLLKPESRTVEALRGVSFRVERGEFIGYIGPNGAGKSTTIKILTSVIAPSGGTVRVLGFDPWRDRFQYTKRIGVIFGQKTLLMWDLPLRDSFELYRAIYRQDHASYKRSTDRLIQHLNVGPFLHTPVRKLSLGQRMRGELVAALAHMPEVLFLDEPTIGLDFEGKMRFRELLESLHRELGLTVILTSHDLAEVEQLASRVLVLNAGKVAYDGRVAELREESEAGKVLHVRFSHIHDPELLEEIRRRYRCHEPGAHELSIALPRRDLPKLLPQLFSALSVSDLQVKDTPLQDLLARWYRS